MGNTPDVSVMHLTYHGLVRLNISTLPGARFRYALPVDAAKLFQEEVRELMPDVPRKELCDMVDDYIYYQTDDMSRKEAHEIVEATCISEALGSPLL